MKIVIACSLWARLRGLKRQKDFSGVLMLAPCNDVHTFGMTKPIDIAFVSTEGLVMASYKNIGKRQRMRCRKAAVTLERFSRNTPWFKEGEFIAIKSNQDK